MSKEKWWWLALVITLTTCYYHVSLLQILTFLFKSCISRVHFHVFALSSQIQDRPLATCEKKANGSHFILIVYLLTLYKSSVDFQSHLNSVSVNTQQKCLLTVNMFGCNRFLTSIQLTICTLSQHLLSWLSVIVSWKSTVWCQHMIKNMIVIDSRLSTDY